MTGNIALRPVVDDRTKGASWPLEILASIVSLLSYMYLSLGVFYHRFHNMKYLTCLGFATSLALVVSIVAGSVALKRNTIALSHCHFIFWWFVGFNLNYWFVLLSH